MNVEVGEGAAAHPVAYQQGFGEVKEGVGTAEEIEVAETQGSAQTAPDDGGIGDDDARDLAYNCGNAGGFDVVSAIGFGSLDGGQVLVGAVGVVNGGHFDIQAALTQAEDFFQEEGMRDRWVPAKQVSDAGPGLLTCWQWCWERVWQRESSIGWLM